MGWYFGVDEPGRSRIMGVFKATGTDIVISATFTAVKYIMLKGRDSF